MLPDITELRRKSMPLVGDCPGVYFLFHNSVMVHVGHSWNCLLRVAEHTRKDSTKEFTSWGFIPVDDENERKELASQMKGTMLPK